MPVKRIGANSNSQINAVINMRNRRDQRADNQI